MWFRVPSIRITEGHARYARARTYMYLFEWESPLIGAAHAMDVTVFGNGLPLSLLSFIVYIPLQLAFIPLAIVGGIMVGYRQIILSKKAGVSQTAIEILNGRWTMAATRRLRRHRLCAVIARPYATASAPCIMNQTISQRGWTAVVRVVTSPFRS
jgi:hypothetical protein